ncbi:MAG TPA: GNAT family N-acetyltransferase [Caulobacterales bacterium]|nr:GNAT family N-acetyltransferase [Caulobacterales bacterium]
MRIEVIHPRELDQADVVLWRALEPQSPYLTPEWARIVGEARPDARVCVVNGGQAFLGVQRSSRFAAMGLGAPIADYQGLVGDARVEARALCAALKVGRIDLSGVTVDQTLFRPAGQDGSWIVDTRGGSEAYRAGLKARRGEFVRQCDKKLRKVEREQGALIFTAASRDAAHFEIMLALKNAQLRRTGQPEIWAAPWVRQVLEASFASESAHFGGLLFTLSLGERLVAANYFLRAGAVMHDWIMVHDNALDAYSPGVELARRAIAWAADNGVAEVDFGGGAYQYKRQLATGQRMLNWGAVCGTSLSGAVRRAECGLRRVIERAPHPRLAALPGKAMRRMDLLRGLAAA